MNTGTTPRLVQKKTMKALTTLLAVLAVLAVLALITVTLSITITQEALAHRVTGKELTLHSDNGQPQGLWASETHFYVSDPEDDHVYAYQRTDGLRATSKEISLHQDNQDAKGIWGDGTHLWVADAEDKLLYAYSLEVWPETPIPPRPAFS